MNRKELHQIAREMRKELPAIGRAERVVDRTLIRLLRRNNQVQLTIGHPDAYIDDADAEQIARIFGAVACPDPVKAPDRIGSQDGASIRVHATTFTWREVGVRA